MKTRAYEIIGVNSEGETVRLNGGNSIFIPDDLKVAVLISYLQENHPALSGMHPPLMKLGCDTRGDLVVQFRNNGRTLLRLRAMGVAA